MADTRRLQYVDKAEIDRLLELDIAATDATAVLAWCGRINALYMIARAGSGHIGTSFSCMDILSWLYLNETSQIIFSSKGHDAPAMYANLLALDMLDFDLIHTLRRLDGLPGHPDIHTPSVVTNTGSLGMGISKAKGMILANRLKGEDKFVYVLTGDGELQEGQIWESLASAVHRKMGELIVIVDHNKVQSDSYVEATSDLGDLEAKFRSFGWDVDRIDGHDLHYLRASLDVARTNTDTPTCIIADTIKGYGVGFMEHTNHDSMDHNGAGYFYKFHSGAPMPQVYDTAVDELRARLDELLDELGKPHVNLTEIDVAIPEPPKPTQFLIPAYEKALVRQAAANPKLVALDADLLKDCGLTSFKAEYPDRFFECGIAEMDMVSTAGGMALSGLLPVVHSFACFLTPRANEQIYNNATEETRIIYAGSLAGVVPGGPGHSHQAVRDIAALSGIPGMVMMEPCCEKEVDNLLDYCVNEAEGPTYLRLTTIPCEQDFAYDAPVLAEGQGAVIRDGGEQTIFLITYGPTMLNETWKAAEMLAADHGIDPCVINLPWLNRVDIDWLMELVGERGPVFTIDNHYVDSGQGVMIAAGLAGLGVEVVNLGLEEVPACGLNHEVLAYHGLDAAGLCEDICHYLGVGHA